MLLRFTEPQNLENLNGRGYSGFSQQPTLPPPPIPLFVNAKQQKLLANAQTQAQLHAPAAPWGQAVSPPPPPFKQPTPAADVPQLDAVSPPAARDTADHDDSEAEDTGKQSVEAARLSPQMFGRMQFIQVFHDTPLIGRTVESKPAAAAGAKTKKGAKAAAAAAAPRDMAALSACTVQHTPPVAHLPAKEARIPSSNFEIPFDAIKLGELIGQGAFGRVHRGYVGHAFRSRERFGRCGVRCCESSFCCGVVICVFAGPGEVRSSVSTA